MGESIMQDLRAINLAQVDDVSNSKLRALEIRKQNATIGSDIGGLEQDIGSKIKLSSLKAKSITLVSDLKKRLSDLNKESTQYVQKCDLELSLLTEYDAMSKNIQDSILCIRSALINVEKSGDLLPEHFEKIKRLKPEIIENETILEKLRSTIKQSNILSRSPKVNGDMIKSHKDLCDLKEKYDTLSRLVEKTMLTRDKYVAIEHFFNEQLCLTQDKLEAAERHPPGMTAIKELQALTDKLHHSYEEMTLIINDEIDHHSDRYLEFTRDHRNRSNHLNSIDSKIHTFTFRLNQQKEQQARCEQRRIAIESKIKTLESQMESIQKPKDIVQLQNNIVLLKAVLHEVGLTETEIQSLTNDSANSPQLEQSSRQLHNRATTIKTKAEQSLRDSNNSEIIMKEHKHSLNVATDFLQQCQKKYECIVTKSSNLHQLENEYQKITDLLSSVEKNKNLISKCSAIEMTQLRPISDHGVELMKMEIEQINQCFEELENSCQNSKKKLEVIIDQIKQENNLHGNLMAWLQKQDKDLKALDHVDGEESLKRDLDWLQRLTEDLLSKQSDIDLLSQQPASSSKSNKLKEKFDSIMECTKKTVANYEMMLHNLQTFHKSLNSWTHWFTKTQEQRNRQSSLLDHDRRSLIRNILDEKNKRYEEMSNLTSIGEALVPKLSISGGNHMKITIKSIKDQWHQIFDDLTITLNNLEEKIQNKTSMKEILDRTKSQFDRTRLLFHEEVHEIEPLRMEFRIGTEEKERQLHKFENIMQDLAGMSYTVQKLETTVHSEDDSELEYDIVSFVKEFQTFSDIVVRAKDLSAESYKSHMTFENSYLQAKDAIETMKSRIALCKSVNGTSMSLQSRMERIQDLINTDHQDDRIFNQLLTNKDRIEPLIGDIEKDILNIRVDTILEERRISQLSTISMRENLEKSFSNIEEFKTKYDNLSKDICSIRQHIQNNNESDMISLDKLSDRIKDISLKSASMEELALEILKSTGNELPLEMSKNLQQQIVDITSGYSQAVNNATTLCQIQDHFDQTEAALNQLMKNMRIVLDDLTGRWNSSTKIAEFVNISKEINGLSSECLKADLLKEDLERYIVRLHDFPEILKRNNSLLAMIFKSYDTLVHELNGKKSSFEMIVDDFKAVNDQLKNLQDELKTYSSALNQSLPETKLGKFNLLNDLNSEIDSLNTLKEKVNNINTKSVSNRNLSDCLTVEKIEILKVTERNLDDITKHLKLLTTCLNDQEQLEKELTTIRESIYCVETSKLSLTSPFKLNGEILEKKIMETDKNLCLISSIKKEIDQNLIQKRVGCHSEIEELKKLRKNIENIDGEFKSLKEGFNKEAKRVLSIEDDICQLDRSLQHIQDDLKSVSDYGNTVDSKRALLNKVNDIKDQITEKEEHIHDLEQAISEIRSNSESTLSMEKLFNKLEKQHATLKERINSVISKHEISIIDSEKFDEVFKQVMNELCDIKSTLQGANGQLCENDIPNIDSVKIALEQLNRLGETCLKSSSEEGKSVVNRRLDDAKKSWKTVEQLQKQMKLSFEKEKTNFMERQNQNKKFMEWLYDIKEQIEKIRTNVANDVSGKRKKYLDAKGALNDIQEWKREVNKYFDTVKETKSSESEIEMLKDYRTLLSDINNEISNTKTDLNKHLELEKNIEDFMRWMVGIENQISEFHHLRVNVDEIDEQIKQFHGLQMKIKDENSKLVAIRNNFKNIMPDTAKQGHNATATTLAQIEERYENLLLELKKSLQALDTDKRQLSRFWSLFNGFEDWLKEMEEKFATRTLLINLSDKERKLKTCQKYLLSIYDQKEKLEELLEGLKDLPINLALNHSLRGVQARYSSLSNLAQSHVDQLAKWEANHLHFAMRQNDFSNKSVLLTNKVSKLNDGVQSNTNVEQLLAVIDEIEKDVIKIEEIKMDLESSLQTVLQETISAGHEEINKEYFKEIQKYTDTRGTLKGLQMTTINRQTQENRVVQFVENLTDWIEIVKKAIISELLPKAQISTIKRNLATLDSFLQDTDRKKGQFLETKQENSAVKDVIVLKRFSDVEKELQCLCKDIKDKKSFNEKLLESNETYYQTFERICQWIEETGTRIKAVSANYGTEPEIDERMTSVRDIKVSISSQGKSLLDATVDTADAIIQLVSEKSDKEKILKEVDKVEQSFLDLTQKSEQIEDKLNMVSQQWKQYRRNIDELTKFIRKCQKKKQQLLDSQNNYSSDIDGCIEKLQELTGEISDEKVKLEIIFNQTHSLKEISQEPQVEIVVQEFMDQLTEQDMDCKFQLGRLHQLKNEKALFDDQYHKTNEWIQNMKSSIIDLDQLHDVPSFIEFQKHFSNLQLLDSKIIAGDRIVDNCHQIANRLSSLCDSDKEVSEMMKMVQKSWNNLKEKFSEIKSRLSRLIDVWTTLDHFYTIVDDWIIKTNKDVDDMVKNGYVSEELKDKTIRKLKEFNSSSESIKPKLSKILELFHIAETYSAFTKRGDPLHLQQRFCDCLETMKVFEKQLQSTQNNIDKFYQDISEIEKNFIDTSLIINDKCRTTDAINSTDEINNQLKFCQELRHQITNYEDENIAMLIRLKETIDKQLLNPSALKTDISSKKALLTQSLHQLQSANYKWKQSLKQRLEKIKRFKNIIHSAERLIYTELRDWWTTKEKTTTMSPDNCLSQIKESELLLEKIASAEMDFHPVWLDNTNQRQLLNKSQSMDRESLSSDSLLSQSFRIFPDNHLDQIKNDFKDAKDRVYAKLEELKKHKEKWLQIENDIEDLEAIFKNTYSEIEQIIKNQSDNDLFYDQFEDSVSRIISKRSVLESLNEQINLLNGNNDSRGGYGIRYYKRYAALCQDYSGILQQINNLRDHLRSFNAHKTMDEITRSDFPNNLTAKPFPEFGTQTQRHKASSIRTLKRHLSNPNLNDPSLWQRSEFANNLRKSVDTGHMTQAESFSKRVQTVNDVGIQSKHLPRSISNYADKVMKDKISFDKRQINKLERKEDRHRRFNELLSTINSIKEDMSSLHSTPSIKKTNSNHSGQKSPTRSSVESVRHNIKPTNRMKKPMKKQKRSKSRESLGSRPSPTGCSSPKSVKGEQPRKCPGSPKKSSSRSSPIRQIMF